MERRPASLAASSWRVEPAGTRCVRNGASVDLCPLVGQSTAHPPRVNFMSTRNSRAFSGLSDVASPFGRVLSPGPMGYAFTHSDGKA